MTWTPEQILEALKIVFTFFGTALLTVGGWFVVSKLNKANTEKAKAEAAAIYQEMAKHAAEREVVLLQRIETLDKDLSDVKEALTQKVEENSDLQRQIAELKVQTDEQAQEINDLREEVNTLRAKRNK